MRNSTSEYGVEVLVRGSTVATEVSHRGTTYIEGREGTDYTLRLTNNTWNRVLMIPSVDGLCVLDGKPAGVGSPGYIVPPRSHIDIPGWKVDSATAAKFVFAGRKPKRSKGTRKYEPTYAEQIGADMSHLGLIGAMVFREKVVHHPVLLASAWHGSPRSVDPQRMTWNDKGTDASRRINLSASACASSNNYLQSSGFNLFEQQQTEVAGSVPDQKSEIGTGFGEATTFKTKVDTFVRANPSIPDVTFVLRYDTLEHLEQLGVPVDNFRRGRRHQTGPNPFPASPHVTGSGCPVPRGWKKN